MATNKSFRKCSNTMKIEYKLAEKNDAESIAKLHALSWQTHYRGIYPDAYLDNGVLVERLQVWQDRFAFEDECRLVIKATDPAEKIIGFACTFLDHDSQYGALIDNLHVIKEHQNQGIGKKLLQLSAKWVFQNRESSNLYLFVLNQNSAAKAFYLKMGARILEPFLYKNPAGKYDQVVRCTWTPMELIQKSF